LREVRKRILISFCLCAACAGLFYFHFAFARLAQAILFFISPLPAVRKPLFFLKHYKFTPFELHGKTFSNKFIITHIFLIFFSTPALDY